MNPLVVFSTVLAFFIGLRLFELRLAARNARLLLARGAREVGAAHYPWMVASHVLYFALLVVEVGMQRRPLVSWNLVCLVALGPVLALRWWTLATLGQRWTTRVVVIPGEAVVARGPYRYLRHPNYVVVVLETALLALAFSAWLTLVVTLPLIFVILVVRIRVEERALSLDTDWAQALQSRPRFVPRP